MDVLRRFDASPVYTAVTGNVLALRNRFDTVATQLALRTAVAMPTPFDVKFTFPVGVIEPEVVTVAVQVRFWP